MEIHQSDLAAYGRCAAQHKFDMLSAQGLIVGRSQLSATVYGTVIHHAVRVLEELHHAGRADAVDVAKATFAHYWKPDNVAELDPRGPVDEWLPRETWAGLNDRGLRSLDAYFTILKDDTGVLLGLEVPFRIPIFLGPDLDYEEHFVVGTADRVAVRKATGKPYLSIEDFKSGKQPTYLRYNVQFSVYCWASTQRLFWDPWGDEAEARFDTYKLWARRGRWINLRQMKDSDAGWRGPVDYERMHVALREYVRAHRADVFPLTIKGDVCVHCEFRNGVCGGVRVPDEDHGRP